MGTARQKKQNEERLLELDALRGLAAVYVLIFHFICSYQQSLGAKAFELSRFFSGIYGVQLFFIISGYVIFMSLDRIARPLDFIVSRFSRLFPAYWAAVIIATFLIKRYTMCMIFGSPRRALFSIFP